MKILKKLNRGAILSFIILVCLIGYLIYVAIINGIDIPKIKDVCEKYIETEISYKMLPKQHRVEKPIITQSELNLYIENMQKDIKAFYTKEEQSSKYIIDTLAASLIAQSKGSGVVFDFKKEIIEYNDIVFDNDTVTVNFTTNNNFEGQNANNPTSKVAPTITQTNDNLILQKINSEWKIIYSNLNSPNEQENMYGEKPYLNGMR